MSTKTTNKTSGERVRRGTGIVWAAVLLFLLLLPQTPGFAADLMHNSAGTGSTKWGGNWGTSAVGSKYGEFTCATCHEPNNKQNIKNIRRVISTSNGEPLPTGASSVTVSYRNVTSLGDDTYAHATSNRICEVCHSQNKFHNANSANNLLNGGAMGHPTGKEICTNCHKHSNGFKAACGGCHGNPPKSASFGNDTGLVGNPRPSNVLQPGQPGAHVRHTEVRQLACYTCHNIEDGSLEMPTQSRSIQLGFLFTGVGGTAKSGTYTPFTSATRGYPFTSSSPGTVINPGNTNPLLANICSNLYCHGGGTTGKAPLTAQNPALLRQSPRWDGANQNACGNCHGGDTSNPPTTGSHLKHAADTGNYTYACVTCHPAHDNTHVQGSVRWQFNSTESKVANAKYAPFGVMSGTKNGATTQLAPSSQYGTCSTVYCHFNKTTPQWGGSLPTDCSGCHGGDENSASPMVKNAHRAHVYNRSARFSHFDFKCQECHFNTVDANNAIANRSLHVNKSPDVAWGTAPTQAGVQTYNGTGASCATTYCHSNGRGGAPNVVPSDWNSVSDTTEGTFLCNACHGGFAGQPNSMNTDRHNNHIYTSPGSNIPHVGIACDKCHDNTIRPDGVSIDGENGLHINHNYNVTFAKFANRSGVYEQANNRSCRSTYCHGRNNPSWNTTSNITCGACHEASNRSAYGLSSSHRKHYNTTTRPTATNGWNSINNSVSNNVFMCGVCHFVNPDTSHIDGPRPNGAAANIAIKLPFNVISTGVGRRQYPADGVPVVNLGTTVRADSANYFYSAETTCSVYCHSDGRGGPPKQPMFWANTTTSCGNCHNRFGDANPTWSGAHSKHLGSPITTAATCNACHAATASGNNTLISGRRDRHPNGFPNLTGSGMAGPLMRFNGANCTNVTCHYGQPTPDWTGGKMATRCISCHGNTATSGNPMAKQGHKAHVNNTSTKFYGFNFKCSECHFSVVMDNNTSIKPTGTGLHVNGSGTVSWGALSTGGGAYNAGACATVYCHSNGTSTTAPTYSPPTNWRTLPVGGQEGTINCGACHGGTGTGGETKITTGRHTKHVNDSGDAGINHKVLTCDRCHKLTTDANYNILTANGTHINRAKDVRIKAFANRSGAYTGGTCFTTYCHGRTNPAWSTATVNCGSCHRSSNTLTYGLSSSHRKHYNSATNVSNNVGTTYGWNTTKGTSTTAYVFYCGVCHNVNPLTDHVGGPTALTTNGAVADVVIATPFSVPADAVVANTVTYGIGQREDAAGYLFSTGTTCTTYCHSNARGGAPNTKMYWGATVSNCGNCHNSGFDSYTAGSWSAPHKKHVRTYLQGGNTNFRCYNCHRATATNADQPAIANFNLHVNGFRNVSSSGVTGTVVNRFKYNNTTKTCSTNYCHSSGQATPNYVNQAWSTIAANCTGCHGSASASNPNGIALSGKHTKHINPATNAMKCAACHVKTADPNDNLVLRSYSGVKNHANGTRTVVISGTYGGTWSSATPGCTNVYCHNTVQNASGGAGTAVNPNWSTLTTNCGSCHTLNSGASGTGSHVKHANVQAISCSVCHGTGYSTSVTTSTHTNKVINVTFTGAAAGTTYTKGTSFATGLGYGTCSNISCHGPSSSASWGGTLNCSGCHGSLSAGHGPHIGDLLSTNTVRLYNYTTNKSTGTEVSAWSASNSYKFGCTNCHPRDAATYHVNGEINVVMLADATGLSGSIKMRNPTSPVPTYDMGVTNTCANIYCHSNGYGPTAVYATTPAWNSTFAAAGGDKCAKCHDNSPNRSGGIAGSAAHNKHAVGIHYKNTFNGEEGKLPYGGAQAVNAAHGAGNRATTISCNICHNGTTNLAANDMNPSCSDITNGCHTNGASARGTAKVTGRQFHVNGATNITFAPTVIATKAQLRTSSFARYTSSATGGWIRNLNRGYMNYTSSYDYSKVPLSAAPAYVSANGCLSIACHNGKTVTWSQTLSCQDCHSEL